ncbi:minichromosome maintenance (MCM) complex subunit, putative [Trypanosoma brucei brucei TREU927]|uniref:Minichromosome maintenance (MCM) complex subunit, putative n=1 Tax=Trypanosoma brucei brucei (strain 927/4 GUTat10.1) TaxID=185431 RepID=Q389T6_TRYB2|nr:minichromosome maintenance complex subunit [Trypanosoma brucei brucei TREU927]EAN78434.1 minichromosome maintenance (MCM) complex subunit, putative [Trypanosoma brucei brucei TREU927]
MSMNGVPQEAVKVLWAVHCSHLAPLSYDEDAVGEMWRLFAGFLAPLQIRSSSASKEHMPCLKLAIFTFTVDLRIDMMETPMRNAVVGQPRLVIPLLEFFKAVLYFQQHQKNRQIGELGSWRLLCIVIGDDGCATPFDTLGASLLGKLVTVRGTVVRMSPPRVTCVEMTYRCNLCAAVVKAPTEDGVLVYPGRCSGRCRGYNWAPLLERGECEEVQLLKVQEQTESYDGSTVGSGIHNMIVVDLRGIWINIATVGEHVVVCGVLCARRGEGRTNATQQIAVRACFVENSRHSAVRGPMQTIDSLEESGRFYEMVRNPQWFSMLCGSLAPSIFGLEHVKEAIILAVVGGTAMKKRTRSNIHLLIVGDPGLGKSQLLRAACTVAPRSSFVCAHTSSSCGLTLTLSRDPTTGETSFEAGAVVHGDGGITCIDEIDKGVPEHNALLEVMEQESVSMAKAGMVFSVPVHTAILTAGNPIGGRFDDTKSIPANLNLSPALFTRFDIVICMRSPSADASRSLSDHVLQLHRCVKGGGSRTVAKTSGPPLPLETVQRFIAFCRHNCHPSLRQEACDVLKAYYLQRRAEAAMGELAVTPRFLQALIRVSEARAKVELRHEVTAEDARYAVELMKRCFGSHNFGRRQPTCTGAAAKKMTQREKILDALKGEVCRTGVNALSHRTVLAACEEAGCRDANAMVYQLNEAGVILQMGGKYQLRGV